MRFARTACSVLVASGLIGAAALAGSVAHAAAEETRQGPSVSVSPSSGPVGTGFTIRFENFPSQCPQVQFRWDDRQLGSAPGRQNGSAPATVPEGATPGPHIVTVQACSGTARTIFMVTPGRAPTTTGSVPAPRPPTSTPTATPGTTTTTPDTTTTTTSTTTPTVVGTSPTAAGRLVFDKLAIKAGEPLTASGTGCEPDSYVTLTANGERVGAATTDDSGAFSAPVEFTRIRPGRQLVTATCGSTVLTGGVDLQLETTASGNTGVLVVLVLVLLAGVTLIAHYRTKVRW